MKRGDLVTVSVSGDHGKPRPAVVVQTDRASMTASVLVCLCTSNIEATADYRLSVQPTPLNGLREPSLVQIDKVYAVTRTKCGPVMGRLTEAEIENVDSRLTFIFGLSD